MAKSRKLNEDDRTTEVGLYHYGLSYWRAATTLALATLKTTHPDSPVSFLYYHAIELLLKSFLRLKGHTVNQLRSAGHQADKLAKCAVAHGLFLMDEDRDVIAMMAEADTVIRSRYIVTGAFRQPAPEALERTCQSLAETINAALLAAGKPVRRLPKLQQWHKVRKAFESRHPSSDKAG